MRHQAIILVLALALGGCGLLGQGLADRSVDYYNYMAGNSPQTRYSSFLSPAYRAVFAKEDLKDYNTAMGQGKTASGHHGAATTDDVSIAQREKFAITVIDPERGRAFAGLQPVKWVKAGRQWYLYLGSDAEIKRYGVFPTDLAPPPPVSETPPLSAPPAGGQPAAGTEAAAGGEDGNAGEAAAQGDESSGG